MTRVTSKEMIWFIMFNIFCVSMQVCLISSIDTDTIETKYYSNNKSSIKNDFNDLFTDDYQHRSLRHYKEEDDVEEEPMILVEGRIPNSPLVADQSWLSSSTFSPSPSPQPSRTHISILDDHNDHTEDIHSEDDNQKTSSNKVPNTCIVMPEETNHCKHCDHPTHNIGVFKYTPSNHYCDVKYDIVNEVITCPQGWTEITNYRSRKKYNLASSLHDFRCTSQKVCCLYN